ncbi:efflux RND transporter periplasmic adaptor subunit [Pantanalinema rosaneae CENA516]|uniref:efflux RND transporter periplasmic adaptor subunit n=1 Tax=Pantanalinema rosaneae TaxID=1620701 RepID=UPI003D6FEFE8
MEKNLVRQVELIPVEQARSEYASISILSARNFLMMCSTRRFDSPIATRSLCGTLLSLLLLLPAARGLAHPGHGDEFHGDSQSGQVVGAIQVDAETAQRLGLKVASVSRQRLAVGIKATGQLEPLPNQQVEVTTPVGGTVMQLLVRPGEVVAAGQPVAIMTSPELAELRTTALDRRAEAIAAVQQAEADLRLAQENYRQQQTIAATEVQQARTDVSFAQERYDKDRELLTSGAIPRRTFLESETMLAAARSALTKAESRLQVSEAVAQLKRAQSNLEVAQSRVSLSGETYQTRLRQLGANPNPDGTMTIVAPIAGTVADRETTPGESGQDAGKKIMTIVNSSRVQVSASIHEKDLSQIQPGQQVRVNVNGLPDRTFAGRISVIGAVVEGESRIVPVKAELDNPNGSLKPGMFAELDVLTDRTPNAVLVIPKSALVETNDRNTIVFVQNGTAFQPAEVTLGRESGDLVEVTSGLFDGDRIVIQRARQLYAQSLRGGGTPSEDPTPQSSVPSPQSSSLPWWVLVPVGGAIATGTFFAGMYWAKRRDRHNSVASELELEAVNPVSDSVLSPQNGSTPASLPQRSQETSVPP